MSSVLPLLREGRKSDFGDVRAAVDPKATKQMTALRRPCTNVSRDVIPSSPKTVRRGKQGNEAWYLPELAASGRR